jgi:hypothetical protein
VESTGEEQSKAEVGPESDRHGHAPALASREPEECERQYQCADREAKQEDADRKRQDPQRHFDGPLPGQHRGYRSLTAWWTSGFADTLAPPREQPAGRKAHLEQRQRDSGDTDGEWE